MKKDEFINVLKQVLEHQFLDIIINYKTEVGLKDSFKTIPFEEIMIDVSIPGSYYMDSKGFSPGSADIKDFTEYPYKNEAERIKVVKGLNSKLEKLINEDKKARFKFYQAEDDSQGKKGKDREKALKKINKLKKLFSIPRMLRDEYPVRFVLKQITKNYKTISFVLDNKIIYNLCLQDKEKTITARWNRTVLEHYRDKISKKYKIYLDPFYEWFADKEIVIDSKGYEAIPLLYDEQTDHELSTAHNIILKQRNEIRSLKLSKSLTRGELTDKDIEQIAEKTRFKNGNLNYTALGKSLGITRQTARKMIIDRKLGYLKKPPQTE